MRQLLSALTLLVSANATQATDLRELDLLNSGWPRGFFFRASEATARAGKMSFDEWSDVFSKLDGIMGKTCDEELPNTQAKNVPAFTRFKKQHPAQAVLLHFNGDARDPRWDCGEFFAGHWLYFNGSRVTSSITAQAGECELKVEDSTLFRINMGRFQDKNEDLGLCALDANGKPDWSESEQLELISIDPGTNTLRVRRGAFGTAPRAFAAGKAYVAAHVTEGPWGKTSHLLWLYNYSTRCPRDAKGRTCSNVLVEDLAQRFLAGGALASFDGLEFDVLNFQPIGGGRGRLADADADGKPDGAIINGINTYGIGVYEFCRQLREKLGPNRIIMADGHSVGNQRSFGILNGIESEGWPQLGDPDIVDWSGGLNRHEYWRLYSHPPALNYINHKFIDREASKLGGEKMLQVPLSISRLVMAAGLFTDSAFTYCIMPTAGKGVGVYDELNKGTENRLHWLGRPIAPPMRLALRTPDILAGDGKTWPTAFVQRLRPEQAKLETSDGGRVLKISAPNPDAKKLVFVLPSLKVPEGDLFVHLRIKADPMKGYPSVMPRLAWVGWRREGDLMDSEPLATGIVLRGQKEEPLKVETGAIFRAIESAAIAGETHKAYAVHPPYKGVSGLTFWETAVTIPTDNPKLTFFSGLNDKLKGKSDGVGMKVEVRRDSAAEEIISLVHTEKRWIARSADLARWAGQTVRLRFSVDPGPAGNAVADHAFWGEVHIESGIVASAESNDLKLTPRQTMTWMGSQWFEAGFYFRNLGPRTVDLKFELESSEPVYLSDLSIHSHTDAILRQYERGVVLANPGIKPYTFALSELLPRAKLRRLQGSADQDPKTNDGSPAGASLTVPARDVLFLVRE